MKIHCIYPGCMDLKERDVWCHAHWGLYPHKCETSGCNSIVRFDDEPWCFIHSPDSGSSKKGYSAYKLAFSGYESRYNNLN